MKILNIQAADKTPSVYLDSEGQLNIEGISIIEHPEPFFEHIVENFDHIDSEDFVITFKFEYFNTASARSIMKLLKAAADFNTTVVWVYEEGDDDMLEAGQDYQEIMYKLAKMPFKFVAE